MLCANYHRGDVADSADAADAATQSLQETPHIIDHPEAWIPLHMCLGLPLVPPALCAQVWVLCDNCAP